MASRGQRGGGSGGTFLVLLGALSILGVTFAAGVYAGRVWWRPGPAASPSAKAGERGLDRKITPTPQPTLTFYQELTAPLTAPPPPPRPAKLSPSASTPPASASPASIPPASVEARRPVAEEPAKPDTPPRADAVAQPDSGVRFTVQVAAYNARGPAEALRATLAAWGHDAYVAESETPAGTRYRVRVGSFATREAAREAAARLAGERALGTFVTTR